MTPSRVNNLPKFPVNALVTAQRAPRLHPGWRHNRKQEVPACVGTRGPFLFLEIQLLLRELLAETMTTVFNLCVCVCVLLPDDQVNDSPSHWGCSYPSGSVLIHNQIRGLRGVGYPDTRVLQESETCADGADGCSLGLSALIFRTPIIFFSELLGAPPAGSRVDTLLFPLRDEVCCFRRNSKALDSYIFPESRDVHV